MLTPTATPSSKPRASGNYEVHEWGVVRALGGVAGLDAASVGAIAPPRRFIYPMEKPVLYFHTDAPMQLDRVRVTTPKSSIIEAWPLGSGVGTESIAWRGVSITPGACETRPLPTTTDAPCDSLPSGVECETPGLDVVRAPGAACVETGKFRDRFLFYRALSTTFVPPLVFGPVGANGEVKVTNIGATPIPGLLVRVVPGGGRASSVVTLPPAPGASITVGLAGIEGREGQSEDEQRGAAGGPGPSALRTTMRDLGLDADEVDAFLGAWSRTMFDVADVAEEKSVTRATASFVYFLPTTMIDAMAKLELDPPPRAIKRAFAVWQALE